MTRVDVKRGVAPPILPTAEKATNVPRIIARARPGQSLVDAGAVNASGPTPKGPFAVSPAGPRGIALKPQCGARRPPPLVDDLGPIEQRPRLKLTTSIAGPIPHHHLYKPEDWDSFESEEAAHAEDSLRWALLEPKGLRSSAGAAFVAKLEGDNDGGPELGSLGSSVAMRAIRIRTLEKLEWAFRRLPDDQLRTATVIKSKWTLTPEQFAKTSAKKIKADFYRDLVRFKITSLPGPLIGFLHGEFEPTLGVFVLHFHVLATSEKAEALHRLAAGNRSPYTKTHTGAVPVKVKPVRARFRQFSYLLKSMWLMKAFRPETGKRDRVGHRILEPYHSLYLLWLDRQKLGDLTIMSGAWSLKYGGPEAMRELYQSIFEGRGKLRSKAKLIAQSER